jgi:hypothetical protein
VRVIILHRILVQTRNELLGLSFSIICLIEGPSSTGPDCPSVLFYVVFLFPGKYAESV